MLVSLHFLPLVYRHVLVESHELHLHKLITDIISHVLRNVQVELDTREE